MSRGRPVRCGFVPRRGRLSLPRQCSHPAANDARIAEPVVVMTDGDQVRSMATTWAPRLLAKSWRSAESSRYAHEQADARAHHRGV
jgi:hypothetical protein